MMAWLRHVLGLDVKERVVALEKSMPRNRDATRGAIEAFKQLAKDARQ
jgi:hypothetical protein